MPKLDKENVDFRGIIVSVPKADYEGDAHEFAFEIEDAYSSTGEHGYPEAGHRPSESSFFSVCYDMDYLPNGLFFNRTSGFTLEHQLGCKDCDYLRFDNMVEFCKWYLQKNGYTCTRPETTVTKSVYKKLENSDISLPEEILENFKEQPKTGLDISGERLYSPEEIRKKFNPEYRTRRNQLADIIDYVEKRLLLERKFLTIETNTFPDAETFKAFKHDYDETKQNFEDWLDEEVY